jgi:hypothetical protein
MGITEDRLTSGGILTWFPLVVRPRPPGLPLEARIAELTGLAARPTEGTCHDRMSQAAEVLNKAALIASDCGMPAAARALCHRQHELFDQARPLPAWAAKLALQPLLNIPRQLIREGQGRPAYEMLETLYQAARDRTTAVIDGRPVDLSTVTCAPDDRKTVCTLIWAALLADGTHALALAGRWKEAASHAAQHRGIGRRLLDGRQAAILALAHDGQAHKAAVMVEQSTITELWEHTVQSLLRVLCLHTAGTDAGHHVATMLVAARALTHEHDRSTAVARARIGMIALDLAGTSDDPQSGPLRAALIAIASSDAYAARDVLAHHQIRQYLATGQRRDLHDLVRACGLGTGTIPEWLHEKLMAAVGCAETALTRELEHSGIRRYWEETLDGIQPRERSAPADLPSGIARSGHGYSPASASEGYS